jgi:hypothetical protein
MLWGCAAPQTGQLSGLPPRLVSLAPHSSQCQTWRRLWISARFSSLAGRFQFSVTPADDREMGPPTRSARICRECSA